MLVVKQNTKALTMLRNVGIFTNRHDVTRFAAGLANTVSVACLQMAPAHCRFAIYPAYHACNSNYRGH
jgi:hypothetical protein